MPTGNCHGGQTVIQSAMRACSSQEARNSIKAGRGRRRGRRSMGRYPWLTLSKQFLDATLPYMKGMTKVRYPDWIRQVGEELQRLHEEGKISATSPKRITVDDVLAYDRGMTERGLKASTRDKRLSVLRQVCIYFNNPVVDKIRATPGRMGLTQKPKKNPKRSFVEETVLKFIETAFSWATARKDCRDGPRREAMLGFLLLSNGFGMRPKEMRFAKYGDLEPQNYRIWISNPKGNGQWEDVGNDCATCIPPSRPFFDAFLEVRASRLSSWGYDPTSPEIPLIPRLDVKVIEMPHGRGRRRTTTRTKEIAFYGSQALDEMFRELGAKTGTPIRPKDGRPSFGQAMKDHGVPIEDISVRMRHTNVQTTQKYYVDLRPDKDFRSLDKYWNPSTNTEKRQPLSIPSD